MATLPARNILDGTSNPTTGAMKAAQGQQRDFLAGLLGTTGTTEEARSVLAVPSTAGLRNPVINGDFSVADRGGGAPIVISSGVNTYGTCDRWGCFTVGASITNVRVDLFNKFWGRITGVAGAVQVGFFQNIEAVNIRHAVGYRITLSATVVCSAARTISARLDHANAINNFAATTPIASAPFAIPAGGTGTRIVIENALAVSSVANGLQVLIYDSAGLPAGVTLDVTEVQVEVKPVASDFEVIPVPLSRMLCQAYFERVATYGITAGGVAGTSMAIACQYKVRKRTTPAINGSPTLFNASAFTLSSIGTDSFVMGAAVTATNVASVVYSGVTIDAEL